MQHTSGTKVTTATAAVLTLVGLAAILYGLTRDDLPRSIAGLGLTTGGLLTVALVLIRRWVTDTREERRLLAASQREAQAERARYFAAQAALECEQTRLVRDMAAERHAIAARLQAEREAMTVEFEEQRATVIAETMEATVLMMRSGKFAQDEPPAGNLIEFPRQHPQRQPERARSREHGVVGP